MAGHPGTGGKHPPLHQRPDQGQKAGGVAPRVGHPFGARNLLPLAGELRESVHPARGHPVGGGAVDDPGVGICHQLHCLHGGGVRQAQKHDIRRIHQPRPLGVVLPLFLFDQQKLDVLPGGQAVANLEARGALPAVNIHSRSAHKRPPI